MGIHYNFVKWHAFLIKVSGLKLVLDQATLCFLMESKLGLAIIPNSSQPPTEGYKLLDHCWQEIIQ